MILYIKRDHSATFCFVLIILVEFCFCNKNERFHFDDLIILRFRSSPQLHLLVAYPENREVPKPAERAGEMKFKV